MDPMPFLVIELAGWPACSIFLINGFGITNFSSHNALPFTVLLTTSKSEIEKRLWLVTSCVNSNLLALSLFYSQNRRIRLNSQYFKHFFYLLMVGLEPREGVIFINPQSHSELGQRIDKWSGVNIETKELFGEGEKKLHNDFWKYSTQLMVLKIFIEADMTAEARKLSSFSPLIKKTALPKTNPVAVPSQSVSG